MMLKSLFPCIMKLRNLLVGIFGGIALILGGLGVAYYYLPSPSVMGEDGQYVERTIASNGSFELHFSSKMNRSSVQEAITFSPSVTGRFEWTSNTEVVFHPFEPLTKDDEITMSISGEARDWAGKRMRPMQIVYTVVSPPQIGLISPMRAETRQYLFVEQQEEEEERELEATFWKKGEPITIMFDRPMKAMGEEGQEDFLHFDPPLTGTEKWLGTNSYEFWVDEESWPGAQTITATVDAGVRSMDGGETEQSYTWTLRTDTPRLLRVSAGAERFYQSSGTSFSGEDVAPGATVFLKWNMPIDLESFYDHYTIMPERTVRDDLFWVDPEDPNVIFATFDPPLEREERITITLKEGILPKQGDLPTTQEYSVGFSTLAEPCFDRQSAELIEPGDPIEMQFCSVMQYWDEEEVTMEELVQEHLRIAPEPEEEVDVNCYDKTCSLWMPKVPGDKITVSLGDGATDAYGQAVSTGSFSVNVGDYPPFLSQRTKSTSLMDKDADPAIYFTAQNIETLYLKLCPVDLEANLWDSQYEMQLSGTELVRDNPNCQYFTETIDLNALRNKMHIASIALGDIDKSKVYTWSAASPDYRYEWNERDPYIFRGKLFFANASLVSKTGPDFVEVWALDFVTGEPIEGMQITGTDGVGTGVTDTDGLVRLPRAEDSYYSHYLTGTKGDLQAYLHSSWTDGISPWDFGVTSWYDAEPVKAALFTDRPIYRPGQTVHIKGIVRLDHDAELSLPDEETFTVTVRNSRYEEVYSEAIPVSEYGTLTTSFDLSEEVPTGRYTLMLGNAAEGFWVEEYKKPSYQILTEGPDRFVQGEEYTMELTTQTYFGASLENVDIEWKVIADPLYFSAFEGGWFSFHQYDCWWWCRPIEGEDIFMEGTGQTDADGKFSIRFPIEELEANKIFSLRITAQDQADQTVSKTVETSVFMGEYLVGVRSEDFYLSTSDTEAQATVVAADPDGNPLEGKQLTVSLNQVRWNSVKKVGIDGNAYYESEKELIPLAEQRVTTNANGRGDLTFDLTTLPEAYGQLQFVVSGEDERGNTITASDSVWRDASGYSYAWKAENHDRMELFLESRELEVGDELVVVPALPFDEEMWALVTVERQDFLYQSVEQIKPGEKMSIPVTERMIPNAFVSVVVAKGKGKEALASADLEVYWAEESFLEAAREELQSLETKEAEAQAVLNAAKEEAQAVLEKALSKISAQREKQETLVINKEEEQATRKAKLQELLETEALPESLEGGGKPAIKMGLAEFTVSAEDKRLELSILPNREEYFPGEEVQMDILVKDAAGLPVSDAELSVAVVDASVLALKARQFEDIFHIFFAVRGLQVQTASSLVYLVDHVALEAQKGAKGGGGKGLASDDRLSLLKKERGEFKDTAYWTGTLVTDAEGNAHLDFQLPDNATTWQVWVTGVTKGSQFGSAKANFMSRKPLLVQPIVPRFFLVGDQAQIGASVYNQTSTAQNIRLKIETEHLKLNDDPTRQFLLQPGDRRDVYFWVEAEGHNETMSAEVDPARLTFAAQGQEEYAVDRISVELPIKLPLVAEAEATSGMLEGGNESVMEAFHVQEKAKENIGNLFVSVTTDGFTSVLNDLTKLQRYPYGCGEQLTSSHLPNLMLYAIHQETPIKNFDEAETKKMIESYLQAIYELQHYNGGFGFWKTSERPSAHLTAYILFALKETRAAGFTVDGGVMDAAERYLDNLTLQTDPTKLSSDHLDGLSLDDRYISPDTAAFIAFVGSQDNPNYPESNLSLLLDKKDLLSGEGLSYLLLAYANLEKTEQVEALRSELEVAVQQTDRKAFVSAGSDWRTYSSNLRATAITFLALQAADENHILLPKFLEYFRLEKQSPGRYLGGAWGSTQNTSWVLYALLHYYERNPGQEATVKVQLNGTPIVDEIFSADHEAYETAVPMEQLRRGAALNEIDLRKTGIPVFYDLVLNVFYPVTEVQPRYRDFSLYYDFYTREDKEKESPITEAARGELLRAKMTLVVPEDRHFVNVTLPIPAGMEAVNFHLDTEDDSLQRELLSCEYYWCWDETSWRFYHKEYRDDHVLLFAEFLPAGRYEFTFFARTTTIGTFQVPPPTVEETYHPEVFGRGMGRMFEIKE